MKDERDSAEIINIADSASRVINETAYQKAMSDLKASILSEWKRCPIRDKEGQTLLLQMAKIADKFESLLTGAVQSGKLERIKLEEMREKQGWLHRVR